LLKEHSNNFGIPKLFEVGALVLLFILVT